MFKQTHHNKFNVKWFILHLKQWRSQPRNFGEAKCLILGKQHYFLWKNASQSTKRLYFLKIFHGPFGSPLSTPIFSKGKLSCSSPRTFRFQNGTVGDWEDALQHAQKSKPWSDPGFVIWKRPQIMRTVSVVITDVEN